MMMLDTDIIIELLKGNKEAIEKVSSLSQSNIQLCTSAINVHEILTSTSPPDKKTLNSILDALSSLKILELDFDSAKKSYEIYASLKISNAKNTDENHLRVLAASIAITKGIPLITRNTKGYSGIPNLKIETW